ncbi:hypothetical protein PSAB6_30414 [Paraburkholderia sabiae]|nr:hypothetical protein PSAB6_30414 [Paraburkholderia sabiae]
MNDAAALRLAIGPIVAQDFCASGHRKPGRSDRMPPLLDQGPIQVAFLPAYSERVDFSGAFP